METAPIDNRNTDKREGRVVPSRIRQGMGEAASSRMLDTGAEKATEELASQLSVSPELASVVAAGIDSSGGVHVGGSGIRESTMGEAGFGKRFDDGVDFSTHHSSTKKIEALLNSRESVMRPAGPEGPGMLAFDSNNSVFEDPLLASLPVDERLGIAVSTLEKTMGVDPDTRLVYPTRQVTARNGMGGTVAVGQEVVKASVGTRIIETAVHYDDKGDMSGFSVVARGAGDEEKRRANDWARAERTARAA